MLADRYVSICSEPGPVPSAFNLWFLFTCAASQHLSLPLIPSPKLLVFLQVSTLSLYDPSMFWVTLWPKSLEYVDCTLPCFHQLWTASNSPACHSGQCHVNQLKVPSGQMCIAGRGSGLSDGWASRDFWPGCGIDIGTGWQTGAELWQRRHRFS